MPQYKDIYSKILKSDIYFDLFEKRGVKYLKIRNTKTFERLTDIRIDIHDEFYTWSSSDNLRRLALKFYDEPSLWWVIGLVNQKPTDGHWKVGDKVIIPINPYVVEGVL
tara:strand:- start:31 stop:357 length:327 start_codon:yes stop_codon:yes gene_type:complete